MLETPIPEIIFGVYLLSVLIITIYTLGEFHLLYFFFTPRKKGRVHSKRPDFDVKELPKVTVQLPMYNERYVAEAVIDSCAQIEYPHDKLEIQVIDDSNDETIEIVDQCVEKWKLKGIDIKVVRRDNREGFKAGALRDATPFSKGDFLAIFDADFRPKPNFLYNTIPYFQDDNVGVVQGRWGHINRDYSMLTKSQSIFLDMFFMIEQKARSLAGYFLRFNGSGGVWRKKCIEDAGGWSAKTLCEDLDLCIRAQLKGWKIIYDITVEAPAEVPVNILDFKAQQYRWIKGKAQVIRKLRKEIYSAPLPFWKKAHVYFDLYNMFVTPSILILAFLSIPITLIQTQTSEFNLILSISSVALINVFLLPCFSWLVLSHYNDNKRSTFKETIKIFFPFTYMVLGMAVFQFVAVIDGLVSDSATFHRTSKYNIQERKDTWKDKIYSPKEVPFTTYIEGFIAIYAGFGAFIDISTGMYGFLPFHIVLFISFTHVFISSFRKK
ncbi:MAG: glycosyltransferase [Balneolaceae bacterium]